VNLAGQEPKDLSLAGKLGSKGGSSNLGRLWSSRYYLLLIRHVSDDNLKNFKICLLRLLNSKPM
jgi:hypothetical protein